MIANLDYLGTKIYGPPPGASYFDHNIFVTPTGVWSRLHKIEQLWPEIKFEPRWNNKSNNENNKNTNQRK